MKSFVWLLNLKLLSPSDFLWCFFLSFFLNFFFFVVVMQGVLQQIKCFNVPAHMKATEQGLTFRGFSYSSVNCFRVFFKKRISMVFQVLNKELYSN